MKRTTAKPWVLERIMDKDPHAQGSDATTSYQYAPFLRVVGQAPDGRRRTVVAIGIHNIEAYNLRRDANHENEANAALICAAPELRDALRDLVSAVNEAGRRAVFAKELAAAEDALRAAEERR